MTAPRTANPLIDEFGGRIRALRKARKATLAQIAEQAAVSVSYLSAVEKGVHLPSLPVIARIATALGVSMAELVTSSGAPANVLTKRAQLTRGVHDVSHPQLHLRAAIVVSGPGDAGECPVPLTDRDLFVIVTCGQQTVVVDGVTVTLHERDALDVSNASSASWRHTGRVHTHALWVSGEPRR